MSETIVAYQSFIGVDLHKNTVFLAAVQPDATRIDRVNVHTICRDGIVSWLFRQPCPLRMAVEAIGFIEWFIDDYRGCVDCIEIATAARELTGRHMKIDWEDVFNMIDFTHFMLTPKYYSILSGNGPASREKQGKAISVAVELPH